VRPIDADDRTSGIQLHVAAKKGANLPRTTINGTTKARTWQKTVVGIQSEQPVEPHEIVSRPNHGVSGTKSRLAPTPEYHDARIGSQSAQSLGGIEMWRGIDHKNSHTHGLKR
jgi:hypothetical protein